MKKEKEKEKFGDPNISLSVELVKDRLKSLQTKEELSDKKRNEDFANYYRLPITEILYAGTL